MNHRRFRRIPFTADVNLEVENQVIAGELLDLAMKGALVGLSAEHTLTLGETYLLTITLPGSPIEMKFDAELVHVEDDHYGFKFISENLATLTHLRKLIELNTGDVEATRSELMDWLKK